MVLQMAEKHLSMFMVALFCFYKADMQRVKVEGAALMLRTQKLVHFLQNICCDVAETSNLLAFAYILFLCAEKACESIEIETGNYLKPTSYPRNADFRHLDRERVEAMMDKLYRFRGHLDVDAQMKNCEAMVVLLDDVITSLSYDPDFCTLT